MEFCKRPGDQKIRDIIITPLANATRTTLPLTSQIAGGKIPIMTKKILLFAILIWFFFAALAILNGLIRNSVYGPMVGELAAHQISTIIFCLIILLVTLIFVKTIKPEDSELIWIGFFWLCLTIAFEFVFGHYVIGHPWSRLFADYNLLQGRVWLAVLITTLFAPLVVRKVFKA